MRLIAQEREGILQCGQSSLLVVECGVGAVPLRGDLLGEGGLAALTGAVQHHHAERVQRFADSRPKMTLHMPHDKDPRT